MLSFFPLTVLGLVIGLGFEFSEKMTSWQLETSTDKEKS